MKRFATLTDEEIAKVLEQSGSYGKSPQTRLMWSALFTLLSNLGLRITEAVTLQWKQVDFERGEITVSTLKKRATKCPTCGKKAIVRGQQKHGGGWHCSPYKGGCGARFQDGEVKPQPVWDTLPLDQNTLAALSAWKGGAKSNDPIFPVSRKWAYAVFQRLLHYAHIRPIRMHALRHSAVTRWVAQTGDLAFARDMARHEDISTTSKYTHCANLRERFQGVQHVVGPAPPLPMQGAPVPPVEPPRKPAAAPADPNAALVAILARVEAALLSLGKPQVNGDKAEIGDRPGGGRP